MVPERRKFDSLLALFEQVKANLELVHTPTRQFDTGVPLFKVEIHIIQLIGENPGITSTCLAEKMGVTKSAVSQTLNKLLAKGLARKNQTAADARESNLELTDLGWKGFYAHERFHQQIFEEVREYFGDSFSEKLDEFEKTMTELNKVLLLYAKRHIQNSKNNPT